MNSDGTDAHQVTNCRPACVADLARPGLPMAAIWYSCARRTAAALGACTSWSCPRARRALWKHALGNGLRAGEG
jgi:hypothetical protein